MAYITKHTDRMDIHIEEYRGTILIRQKWKYQWKRVLNTPKWTLQEKRAFHQKADRLIWTTWGKHFFVRSYGNSPLAKKHQHTRWDINFDIQWVLDWGHWDVFVTKLPSNYVGHMTSSVKWKTREIFLDTKDVELRERYRGNKKYHQYPVAHEYGHAVGNSKKVDKHMHGDEYKKKSAYFNDKSSMMNVGMSLRERHLDYLIRELNTMVPDTIFAPSK